MATPSETANTFPSAANINTTSTTTTKTYYSTPNPYEQSFGYHRAIRKGNLIFVSGTTALKDTQAQQPAAAAAAAAPPPPNENPLQQSDQTGTNPNEETPAPAPHKRLPAYYQNFLNELQYDNNLETGNLGKEYDSTEKYGQPDRDDSKVLYPTDARKQASIAMERCVTAVEGLGGTRADVVRVKMFVSRHEDCADVGAAFKECFSAGASDGDVGATATMIVVQNGFVDPDILVEVEVDAIV